MFSENIWIAYINNASLSCLIEDPRRDRGNAVPAAACIRSCGSGGCNSHKGRGS